MPLPVISDCAQARFVFNNGNAPRDATVNLHFQMTGASGEQEADLFNAINSNVTLNMWKTVATGTYIKSVAITRLDGASAAIVFNTYLSSKWQGQGSADLILQGATVVSIPSSLRGPAYRNRIYLPWVGEGTQLNGTLDSTAVSSAQSAWTAFRTAMGSTAFPLLMVSPFHATSRLALNPVVRPFVRTQRRRVRR